MKSSLGVVISILAVGLFSLPARAATTYSISPVAISASPGDVGDMFEVDFTNNGPGSVSVAGFSFEITVNDPDITLTGAGFSTTAFPYIFAGDSFDQINSLTLDFAGIDTTNQTLQASDITNDGAGITLGAGETLALGEVMFSVADPAAPGPFALSFTGSTSVADLNSLSGPAPSAILIPVDTFSGGTISVNSATPEPSSLLLALGAMASVAFIHRRRRTPLA
jgi:hypothetical protein